MSAITKRACAQRLHARCNMAGHEGGGDLGEYVNAAIKRQLFWDTVGAVQERNQDLSPEEAEALADEALDWTRATRP